MTFPSFHYILLFLPVIFFLTRWSRRAPVPRLPQIILLAASVIFYGWGQPSRLGYLFASILCNWLLARAIDSSTGASRKRYLQLGLFLNIGYLCTFKYLNFFLGNLPNGLRRHVHVPDLNFPLGISLFTLTQVMYLIDCYETLTPANSLFDHATFVAFFPYVISGPLARARRIVHQFAELNGPTPPTG